MMARFQQDIQMNSRMGRQMDAVSGGALARLKERVAQLERGDTGGRCRGGARPDGILTGFPAVDRALPSGGLVVDGVHEVTGMAADGFLLRLLSSATLRAGSILWCVPAREEALLYGAGLAQAGLPVERLLIARFRGREEGLWAMEEGLRSGGFAAVVAEIEGRIDLTASRRLQLAAEKGRAPGFLLNRVDSPAAGFPQTDASALSTRWRVDPIDEERNPDTDAFIRRWAVTLSRCRGGARGSWEVRLL